MLGRRRRRWPNIEPTLVQRVVFAGCLPLNPSITLTYVHHKLFISCAHLIQLYIFSLHRYIAFIHYISA